MPVPLYMTTRFGARHLQPWIRFRSSFSHSRLNASGPMADLALSDQRVLAPGLPVFFLLTSYSPRLDFYHQLWSTFFGGKITATGAADTGVVQPVYRVEQLGHHRLVPRQRHPRSPGTRCGQGPTRDGIGGQGAGGYRSASITSGSGGRLLRCSRLGGSRDQKNTGQDQQRTDRMVPARRLAEQPPGCGRHIKRPQVQRHRHPAGP